ncbi:type II 3-dehydroquinate dehydratase [Legionella fairfieldensis]|uniref:type II 3-dehydroquinate dehydratase n=1 Tax=Legionella fairfieldensis TaxID=45064 RepID=UPI0004902EF6|nr:type II 3-dehydroquinate dehydratase [Legionella fairfieldensis]
MKKILVLHGPNLNRLGLREPSIYGSMTLTDLNKTLVKQAEAANFKIDCQQSNSEAELIALIHQAADNKIDYLIVNPAAFTHTSLALRDALLATSLPFIEVHISNIHAREAFRQHSYFSDIARGVISGFGVGSYFLALQAIINEFN